MKTLISAVSFAVVTAWVPTSLADSSLTGQAQPSIDFDVESDRDGSRGACQTHPASGHAAACVCVACTICSAV